MFKDLGNLASLVRQAQQMGGRMKAINEKLKSERATASTGAGMVEVEVNGLGEVLRVKIDPSLVERGDREMIEDLIPAAVNEAVVKARQLHVDAMKTLTDELSVPGLEDAIKQITDDGGNDEEE
jgi:DNA-binding YbaB/EbfC family protein